MTQITDFVAQSYVSHSPPLAASRCVNMYAEIEPQDVKAKTPVPVFGHAGLAPFADAGGTGPVLAFHVMNDIAYCIVNQTLFSVDSNGRMTSIGGTLVQPTGVSIDDNGLQLVWVDGLTGWCYQPGGIQQSLAAPAVAGDTRLNLALIGVLNAGDALLITLDDGSLFTTVSHSNGAPGSDQLVLIADPFPSAASVGAVVIDPEIELAQITDANFFPAKTVAFFDGYFCFDRVGTKEFFLSPLYGIVPFNGAMFASKEATPDLLLGVVNSHEQLFLFGEQRTEVWYDTGNAPPSFPFQRNDGALIQRGTLSAYSVVLEDNTLFWLGDDGVFYRLNGFLPQRVSTHATEGAWQKYPTMTDCRSFSYTLEGHKFIHVTFPTGRVTWVYDVATSRWHERESWLGGDESTTVGRWRGNCCFYFFDRVLIGDYFSGKIGQVNPNDFTEFGATIRGLLVGAPIHADRRRVFMRRFEIDVESGVGLVPAVAGLFPETYCTDAVVITGPTSLATGSPLRGLNANFPAFVFSVWLLLQDDSGAHGMIFTNQIDPALFAINPGLFIKIANDETSTPQVKILAVDDLGSPILLATYDFAAWGDWVNFLVSVDTSTQQIQVWTSTLAGGVLTETELTAVALTWSSSKPIGNPAGLPWKLLALA